MAEGEDPLLKATKQMIRSVVISVKDGVPAWQLNTDYQEFTGESIPYKRLGYSSLDSFMKSIPDVITVRKVQGEDTYFAVADQTTQHLQNLIQKQKSNPKKKLKKGPPTRYPKTHSQVSRTPPSSWGGGYFNKTRSNTRPISYQTRSFGRERPILEDTPEQTRLPILPTPFSAENMSPLTVTVRPRALEGEKERVIERRGGNGGRQMVVRAVKDIVGQRNADRKTGARYEMPPRFQRRLHRTNGADASKGGSGAIPVAVVKPSQHGKADKDETAAVPADLEASLPSNIKAWTAETLQDYISGLWSSRLVVLYEEAFGEVPPSGLMDLVQTWTDIAKVELNTVANRYVIYPVSKEQPASAPEESVMRGDTTEETPTLKRGPQPWQDYNVPVAILFDEGEVAEVFASTSTDPGNFYLQRADSCVEDITETLLEAAEELEVPTISDLLPGVFCAAQYSQDLSWYRARVLYKKSETEVHVIFIDYGNTETVHIDNIRNLREDIAAIPAQAVNCAMYGIKPLGSESDQPGQKGWSEESKAAFHAMLSDQTLHMVNKYWKGGACVVELWLEDGDISVNEKLCKDKLVDHTFVRKDPLDDADRLDGVGSVQAANCGQTPLMDCSPAELELSQEGYLEVVVAFADTRRCWLRVIGKEYSVLAEDGGPEAEDGELLHRGGEGEEKLETLEDQLSTLYNESTRLAARNVTKLKEDSVCIAHCDPLYHRVKIRDIKNGQAACVFLDHGYTEWLPLDQLVPLDSKVNASLPYQAVLFNLVGLELYMSNIITIMELVERSKNKICVAEVIDSPQKRDKPLKVMLYDTHGTDDININLEIAKKLVDQEHAIDMTLFSPIPDNASDSSHTSASPPPAPVAAAVATPPPQVAATEPDVTVVEQLQSDTQALTLKDTSTVNPTSVIDSTTDFSVNVTPSALDRTEKSAASVAAGSEVAVSQPRTVVNSTTSVAAGQAPPVAAVPANPYGDSLCVAYNTWPLPGNVPLPDVGTFFAVYVQSVVDPSNFVIVPYNVLGSLESLMVKMNERFSQLEEGGGAEVQTPTKVPSPQPNHLYMATYNSRFYRAIYLATTDKMHHVLLPDYSFHVLISAEDIFFLPKAFWSTPFAAFRAALLGIKPAGGKGEKFWSESVKYKFTESCLDKTLMAVIKGTETSGNRMQGADSSDGDGALQPSKKLLLHLVDTSDPETDIVIHELLLKTCSSVTTED